MITVVQDAFSDTEKGFRTFKTVEVHTGSLGAFLTGIKEKISQFRVVESW